MDRSAGHDFGAGGDAADDRQIAPGMMDRLARAQVRLDDERPRRLGLFRLRPGAGARLRRGRRVYRAPSGDDGRQVRPDREPGSRSPLPWPEYRRRARSLRRLRYSLRPISIPPISRMTGFAAKKVGERKSQASSATNHSGIGWLGSRTKARSDRARKLNARAGGTRAFIAPIRWRLVNQLWAESFMKC